MVRSKSAYVHATHNCFVNALNDTVINENYETRNCGIVLLKALIGQDIDKNKTLYF